MHDKSRRVWEHAIAGQGMPPEPPASLVGRIRNSARYQGFVHTSKWNVLPNFVVAPLIGLFLVWLLLAAVVQAYALPILEAGTQLCPPSSDPVRELVAERRDFLTREVCSASFGHLTARKPYAVTFEVVDPWYDGQIRTTPGGIGVRDLPWGLGYLGAPFRRVVTARYLQPVVEVRLADQHAFFWRRVQIYPLALRPVGDSDSRYQAEFAAPQEGEVFLFANDAMIPLTGRWIGPDVHRYFYGPSGQGGASERANRGSACVTIARLDLPAEPLGLPAAGSICAEADARALAKGR